MRDIGKALYLRDVFEHLSIIYLLLYAASSTRIALFYSNNKRQDLEDFFNSTRKNGLSPSIWPLASSPKVVLQFSESVSFWTARNNKNHFWTARNNKNHWKGSRNKKNHFHFHFLMASSPLLLAVSNPLSFSFYIIIIIIISFYYNFAKFMTSFVLTRFVGHRADHAPFIVPLLSIWGNFKRSARLLLGK